MSVSKSGHEQWPQVLERIPSVHRAPFQNSYAEIEPDGSLTIWLPHTANIELIENRMDGVVRQAVQPIYGDCPINYQLAFPALPEPVPAPPPIRDTAGEFALLMAQEREEKDIISFKRIFVKMCQGDTLAGLLLSQIVFWHTPNKQGKSKLRIYRDGEYWIAKTREEWEQDTTINARRVDRLIDKLVDLGLLIKANYRFNGIKKRHVRIDKSNYIDAYHKALRG